MASSRCPICGRPAQVGPVDRSRPFCSDRCRLVDLGRWLGEEYRIAGPRAGDGAEQPPGRPRPEEGETP